MIDFQHIAFSLIAIIFLWVLREISELKAATKDHEKRIQHIEDLHGRDIEEIKKILQELSTEVKALNKYIHKDNHDLVDFLKQQSDVILRIHKVMNEKENIA